MTDLHEDLRQSLTGETLGVAWLRRLVPPTRLKPVIVVGAVIWIISTAYLRVLTGPDLRLAALNYVAAVIVTAWFAGREAGYFIALLCSVAWFLADAYGGITPYTHHVMAFVNTGIRLVVLVIGVRWLSALSDLTTRLEGVVEERTRALRRLASELSDAEDTERRRLAHDIHDGFSQMLSVLKLNLAASVPEVSAEGARGQHLSEALQLVNELIQRSRTLTFDLHPSMLDHFGLVATLRHFAEQFSRQTNIEVTVNEEGTSRPLPEVAANYLFRSIKELINNAARHGHAKQIVVSVYWIPSGLRIVIDDDGSGFNPAEVFAPGAAKGLGLAGIHERMRSFGGNLRLESNPGTGTRVVLEFPLNIEEKVV